MRRFITREYLAGLRRQILRGYERLERHYEIHGVDKRYYEIDKEIKVTSKRYDSDFVEWQLQIKKVPLRSG